jgi:hypothetical protein
LGNETHDPIREAGKLREHLSAFDRPIVFLIGAGASASVRAMDGTPLVPAVLALTEQCRIVSKSLGTWALDAWEQMVRDIESKSSVGTVATVEDLLSSIRDKLSAMSVDDISVGATYAQLQSLERAISDHIACAATPAQSRIPARLPHHSLARWIGRVQRSAAVEIFTTNYDTLLETALEDERLPIFDGFVGSSTPFFMPATLARADAAPAATWTRLWKIHGSVNWKMVVDPLRGNRIVRQLPGSSAHLILPSSQKYDQSRKLPYIAMLDRLTKALTERDGTLLITIGFSFGDQHINEILVDALERRDRLHVVALQFTDPPAEGELSRIALANPNVMAYGPKSAIIGGVRGNWRLLEPVTSSTSSISDVIFDSDAAPEVDDTELEGRFRLGDFNWFAMHLDEIAGARG